jgi:hypothetical protein
MSRRSPSPNTRKIAGSLLERLYVRLYAQLAKGAIDVRFSRIVVDSACQPSSHKDGVVLSYKTGGSSLLGAYL